MLTLGLLGRIALHITLALAGRPRRRPAVIDHDASGSAYLLLAVLAAVLLLAAPGVLIALLVAGISRPP